MAWVQTLDNENDNEKTLILTTAVGSTLDCGL